MPKNHHLLLLIFVILVASFVRIWNLESNPAWYTDEGTHIEIARHLINGKTQYLGIAESYLIAARLPLFEHLLAFWLRLTGVSMLSLRILTSFCGVLTVALVYRLCRQATSNPRFALYATALFAVYPQAVIYSRFGFSYNLLTPLILLGIYGLVRHHQSGNAKSAIFAGLMFGVATLSDFIAFAFLPSALLIAFFTNRRHIFYIILIMVAPFMVYAAIELRIHPDIFLHDVSCTLSRTGGLPLDLQIENLTKNIAVLMTETWWIPLGAVGLLCLHPLSFRVMLILLVILPILISGRTVALYNLSAYYMIPFLPFIAIGIASLIAFIEQVIHKQSKLIANLTASTLIAGIFIVALWGLVADIRYGFQIGIEQFLIDADEAHQIEDYIIDYAKEFDLIITSPTLAWMFDAQVTDFQIASLTSQSDSVHFPASLYPERFAYEVNYRKASYTTVGNLWRDWGAIHMPVVAAMLQDIQSNWLLVFQTENIKLYQNPDT